MVPGPRPSTLESLGVLGKKTEASCLLALGALGGALHTRKCKLGGRADPGEQVRDRGTQGAVFTVALPLLSSSACALLSRVCREARGQREAPAWLPLTQPQILPLPPPHCVAWASPSLAGLWDGHLAVL